MKKGLVKQRLYSEKELRALIQRATELQQGKETNHENNLTFLEVERIASDLGIESENLRTAAYELENPSALSRSRGFWQAPFQIDLTHVADGKLTDEQWEEIVLLLRRETGHSGITSDIGKTKEWLHCTDIALGLLRVSVSPRGDETLIAIQKQFKGPALFTYALSIIAGGILSIVLLTLTGAGAVLPPVANIALMISACAASLFSARAGISAWIKRKKERYTYLVQEVRNKVFAPAEPTPQQASLLDLPDIDDTIGPAIEQQRVNNTATKS